LDDGGAIKEFFETLRSISPYLEELAQAMLKTTKFWDSLPLSAADIDLPAEFLEGLTKPNPVQGIIHTKSSTVAMSTSNGKAVVTRIESAKNTGASDRTDPSSSGSYHHCKKLGRQE
jgi:hypothetical protein